MTQAISNGVEQRLEPPAMADKDNAISDARPCHISQKHWNELVVSSNISPQIAALNFWTIEDAQELDKLLNRNPKRRWKHSEDLVPAWAVAGVDPAAGERTYLGAQAKPDNPRSQVDREGTPKPGKFCKYENTLDVPATPLFLDTGIADYWLDVLTDPSKAILLSEGAKKAGAGLSVGLPTISIAGVSAGQKLGRLKPELKQFCGVGRTISLCFDNDLMFNPQVQASLDKLGKLISAAGAVVKVIILPEGLAKGLDDFIAMHGEQEIRQLVNDARTFEEWREECKKQRQESSDSIPDFAPSADKVFVQKAFDALYSDKPTVCIDDLLYRWSGTYYELSSDPIERRRIAAFCNTYATRTPTGAWEYAYALPGYVEQVLKWTKQLCGVNPETVNPAGLNCTNGILEITWSGPVPSWKLIPHDPRQIYTYAPKATYNPAANPEYCDRVLECLEAPQQDIFLKTIAASLDLATVRKFKGREVRALLLQGLGNNGKDTLRKVVSTMYNRRGVSGVTLADGRQYDQGRKFPFAGLHGSKVNWPSENADFGALDRLQGFKAAITGDPISIERKGKDEYPLEPSCVFLFNLNDTPELTASQEAIQSRYGILSFGKTYKLNPDIDKGELQAQPRFKDDPEFLEREILPAFLNHVLNALVQLMHDGIDYSSTQQAMEEVQCESSHLFQFAKDTGFGYARKGKVYAGDIWGRLKQWYIGNGTLEIETNDKGKEKYIWYEQAKPGDRNVKAPNQIIQRFLKLFPKAKRGGKDEGGIFLTGLAFLSQDEPNPEPTGSAAEPTAEPTAPSQQGTEPTEPIFQVGGEIERIKSLFLNLSECDRQRLLKELAMSKIGSVGSVTLLESDTASATGSGLVQDCFSSGSEEDTPFNTDESIQVGDRVHYVGSKLKRLADGKPLTVMEVEAGMARVKADEWMISQLVPIQDLRPAP